MSSTKDDKRAALWRDMGRASKKIADQFDQKTSLPLLPLEILPSRRVTVGKLLGTGGFNTVHEVTVQPDDPKDKKAKVLARKQLKKTVMEYRDEFYAGAVDLATEAKLLNSLRHKNVITIHGVSHDSFDKAYLNGEQLALYLDRLYGTVDETFDKWRRRYAPREKKQELFRRIERIALPVAEALKFLHSHHIIFRDIKVSLLLLQLVKPDSTFLQSIVIIPFSHQTWALQQTES
jgi:serine/threonine protein kinase